MVGNGIGKRVTDMTGGSKAWTREAIQKLAFTDDRYSHEVEIIVHAPRQDLRLKDVPVRYASRGKGASIHANNLSVNRAGFVIIGKAIGWSLRG